MRAAYRVLRVESEWHFVPWGAVDGSRVRRGVTATLWVSCIDWDCVDRLGAGEREGRKREQLEGDVDTAP
jgi:hypothetical protein